MRDARDAGGTREGRGFVDARSRVYTFYISYRYLVLLAIQTNEYMAAYRRIEQSVSE